MLYETSKVHKIASVGDHVIVNNGRVKLEGVVANQADKNIVGIRTNAVARGYCIRYLENEGI